MEWELVLCSSTSQQPTAHFTIDAPSIRSCFERRLLQQAYTAEDIAAYNNTLLRSC